MTIKFVRNSYFVIVQGKHTRHVDKVKTLSGKVKWVSKCLYSN